MTAHSTRHLRNASSCTDRSSPSRRGGAELILATLPKPRNPFVAAAHQRAAGRHGPQGGARRQRDRQALRQELATGSAQRWPTGGT
jgi:hypothetical protein